LVKWRAYRGYLALLAVFLLGAAAGGGVIHALDQHRHAFALGDDVREAFERRRLRALSHRLDLDPKQEREVAEILKQERSTLRALGRNMLEQCGGPLRDERTKIETRIKVILTPEQKKRFEGLVEERRERLWLGAGPAGSVGRER
jgi:hypothetical protein